MTEQVTLLTHKKSESKVIVSSTKDLTMMITLTCYQAKHARPDSGVVCMEPWDHCNIEDSSLSS